MPELEEQKATVHTFGAGQKWLPSHTDAFCSSPKSSHFPHTAHWSSYRLKRRKMSRKGFRTKSPDCPKSKCTKLMEEEVAGLTCLRLLLSSHPSLQSLENLISRSIFFCAMRGRSTRGKRSKWENNMTWSTPHADPTQSSVFRGSQPIS